MEASRHDHLAAVLLDAPERQQRGTMLLSAVQYLLLGEVDHPLGEYLPTIVDEPRPIDDRMVRTFDDFVRAHEDDLRRMVASRTIQTNEVARAASIRVAMGALATESGAAPFDVIEIGAASGLLGCFERYRIRLGDAAVGPHGADLVLAPELLGAPVPALWLDAGPLVRSVVGLDIAPLDLEDPADRRWMKACIWPSQPHRHEQLDRAMAVARVAGVEVRRRDALDIAAQVDELDTGADVAVVSSVMVSYLTEQQRDALIDRLTEASAGRRVHLVALEGETLVPGIDAAPTAELPSGPRPFVLSTSTFDRGSRTDRVLGLAGGQGDWISLLPRPSGAESAPSRLG